MLNNYDFKYIIKKVIIFFIIFFIFSCFKVAKAETHNLYNYYISYSIITPNGSTTLVGSPNDMNYQANGLSFYQFNNAVQLDEALDILYPGQYLIEFYVYSNSPTLSSRYTCNVLTSNFQNINMTTGNLVSNEIKSQCVDVYGTTYNGRPAYRILYSFTYKGASVGYDGITELRFMVLSTPNDWFYSPGSGQGIWVGVSTSNIYDYDTSIINQFSIFKQNATIIDGQNQLINATNNASQQAHNDSLAEQNAINQNTQAQNQTNSILNDDNVSGANSEVDSLLQNNAFNDTSGIQSIINAPLNFINGLTNSCNPIQVTIPYIDTPLSIPCIKQELTNHIPTIVPILSTAINGFIIYRILIDIVYLIKSARNPDDDRIEVLDL